MAFSVVGSFVLLFVGVPCLVMLAFACKYACMSNSRHLRSMRDNFQRLREDGASPRAVSYPNGFADTMLSAEDASLAAMI